MKILYAPILEPGANHATAVTHKRGLYTALVNAGHWVTQWDYLDTPQDALGQTFRNLVAEFKPDLLLTQLHGADRLLPDDFRWLREHNRNIKIINWSGDSHRHSLLGEPMLELMRKIDLLLVPTLDVLPDLEAAGIPARYWNIAFEPPVRPLPDMPHHDIVFQGNVFNDQRRALVEMLRSLPYKVGIYGDWEHADGVTTYDFAAQRALYRNARLAIADNYRPDDLNYVSDRPMQIMAAGGALCLHQRVETMEALTGWVAGKHYIEWDDLENLHSIITFWMNQNPGVDDALMVIQARDHVKRHHSFDARVEQLFREFLPAL